MKFDFSAYDDDTATVIDRLWKEQDARDNMKDLTIVKWGFSVKHEGEIIGGIDGHIRMNWMYIRNLIVDPNYRGHGVAQQLMSMAETHAKEVGVLGMHLKTYAFQAPEFYKKCGFENAGTIEDLPEGYALHFMKKNLQPS